PSLLLDLPSFPTRRSSDLTPGPALAVRPPGHRAGRSEATGAPKPVARIVKRDVVRHIAGGDAASRATPPASASLRGQQIDETDRSEEHTSELQSLAYLVCR